MPDVDVDPENNLPQELSAAQKHQVQNRKAQNLRKAVEAAEFQLVRARSLYDRYLLALRMQDTEELARIEDTVSPMEL
jgi:hypothetical protein